MRRSRINVLLVGILVILAAAGFLLWRSLHLKTYVYAIPVPPPPPAGSVRIQTTRIHSDAHKVEWRWVVRGDRNWRGLGIIANIYILESYDPVEHPLPYRGTSYNDQCRETQVIGLTCTTRDLPGGRMMLEYRGYAGHAPYRISGQPGTIGGWGGEGGSPTPGNIKRASADRSVNILLKGDHILPLPVNVPLYEEVYTERGTPVRHRYFLTIEK
jgi:hypothetical protein